MTINLSYHPLSGYLAGSVSGADQTFLIIMGVALLLILGFCVLVVTSERVLLGEPS